PSFAATSTPSCRSGLQPRMRRPYGEVMMPSTGQRGIEHALHSRTTRTINVSGRRNFAAPFLLLLSLPDVVRAIDIRKIAPRIDLHTRHRCGHIDRGRLRDDTIEPRL